MEGRDCQNEKSCDEIEDKNSLAKVIRKGSTNPNSINSQTVTNMQAEFSSTPVNSTALETTKHLCTDEKLSIPDQLMSAWNLPKAGSSGHVEGDVQSVSRSPSRLVDFSDIKLPSLCGKGKSVWEAPSPHLLPTNVAYPSGTQVSVSKFPINLTKEKKSTLHSEDSDNDVKLEFSFPQFMGNSVYRGMKAKNWGEYKLAKRLIDEKLSCPQNSPAAHLWTGEVTPLIGPQDALCTGNVY